MHHPPHNQVNDTISLFRICLPVYIYSCIAPVYLRPKYIQLKQKKKGKKKRSTIRKYPSHATPPTTLLLIQLNPKQRAHINTTHRAENTDSQPTQPDDYRKPPCKAHSLPAPDHHRRLWHQWQPLPEENLISGVLYYTTSRPGRRIYPRLERVIVDSVQWNS